MNILERRESPVKLGGSSYIRPQMNLQLHHVVADSMHTTTTVFAGEWVS
jgi:hypothetical protein